MGGHSWGKTVDAKSADGAHWWKKGPRVDGSAKLLRSAVQRVPVERARARLVERRKQRARPERSELGPTLRPRR